MAIYATLWGGPSYAVPSIHQPDDVREFRSLAAILDEWRDRMSDPYFPLWGRGIATGEIVATAHYADSRQDVREYPDRVLVIGPRGGLRWEHA